MRTSNEIYSIFSEKGMVVEELRFGTSYRAGGAILIGEAKFLKDHEPAVIEKVGEKAFDGTGYDGRGRYYDIYVFRAPKDNEVGFVPISAGQYAALSNEQKLQIGEEKRSGCGAYYYGNLNYDNFGDLKEIFEKLDL